MIELFKCFICGKIFKPEESTAREMTAAYCSEECRGKAVAAGVLFPRFTPVINAN